MGLQVKAWASSIAKGLFEHGGVRAIFDHARNLIVATVIIAAGLQAIRSGPRPSVIPYPSTAGYVVATIGALLLLLNLADGLRKLSKVEFHLAFQLLVIVTYIVLSWRVAHLILVYR